MVIDDERPGGGHGPQGDGRRLAHRRLPQIDHHIGGVDPVHELAQFGHVTDGDDRVCQLQIGQQARQVNVGLRPAGQQVSGCGDSARAPGERRAGQASIRFSAVIWPKLPKITASSGTPSCARNERPGCGATNAGMTASGRSGRCGARSPRGEVAMDDEAHGGIDQAGVERLVEQGERGLIVAYGARPAAAVAPTGVGHFALVAGPVAAPDSVVVDEVVEEIIVQDDNPWKPHHHLKHRLVPVTVAHLVEGQVELGVIEGRVVARRVAR